MRFATTEMTPDPSTELLLRKAACVEPDESVREAIRRDCKSQRDWRDTIRQAELHGMAPYLYRQIMDAGAEIPDAADKALKALTFRHTTAARIRTRALLEILQELSRHDIDVLVLKGAALAHLIYDPPGLRPMSDIDLLVAPKHLDAASRLLSELGYRGGLDSGLLSDHHHLPTVSRTIDGLTISIEVHHDALTRDNIGSIRLDTLSDPAQEFAVDGVPVRALGHIDMLRHLCRHALEPRQTTKLGSVLDILLYASHYGDAIEWTRVKRDFPEVVTMIQLLGYLVPWPPALSRHVPEPVRAPPRGVGVGMIPLSRLRREKHRAAKLLNPSDWWLRAFYNVPPGRSLAYTKTLRHPVRVLFWLWRRTGKAVR
ncbi:MAG: nucleotidyltransferase family protein [Arenicellales bacterium]